MLAELARSYGVEESTISRLTPWRGAYSPAQVRPATISCLTHVNVGELGKPEWNIYASDGHY
jgi:hypothetical protein